MISRSDSFARVRELVPMVEVVKHYGFPVSRGGFIACPFHGEDDTPSLKVYEGSKGWHCFGCGEGGDVIDFVRRLFSLDARAALLRLNHDFGLGLTDEKPDPNAQSKIMAEREKKAQELERYRVGYDAHAIEARLLRAALAVAPKGARAGELLGRLNYLDWWFSANPWR